MRYFIITFALMFFTGCLKQETRSNYTASGTLNGQEFAAVIKGDSKLSAGLDVMATVKASVATLRGDFMGAIDELGAKALDHNKQVMSAVGQVGGTDWGTMISSGIIALTGGGFGIQQARQRKRDNDKLVKVAAKLPGGSEI